MPRAARLAGQGVRDGPGDGPRGTPAGSDPPAASSRSATRGDAHPPGLPKIAPAPTPYELAVPVGSHREAVTKDLSHLETLGWVRVRRKQIAIVHMNRFSDELLAIRAA